MPVIRPCADLRNNYNEIAKICQETNKPVFITKNGRNDLVLLSTEAYEMIAEERVERKLEEEFDKKYPDFESFRKDVYEKIDAALKDVEEGRVTPMKQALAEMEEEYGICE